MSIIDEKQRKALSGLEDRFDELTLRLKKKLGLTDPVRVLPYHGYATGEVARLRGRALEAETRPVEEDDNLWDDLVRWYRRVESDEIPDARLTARWGEHEEELQADHEGYFELEIEGGPERGEELSWEEVELEMIEPVREGGPASARGRLLVPAAGADFAVVSDLDDTVIRTGADNKLRMARTIFLNNARSRTAFPGVGCLYRALQRDRNPIFYVSSSPWNYYELFDQFLEFQGIPLGPIFLKDFGLEEDHLVKPGHGSHKSQHVKRLMDELPDLDFILFGDSGQEDAEIYLGLAEEVGERIEVIFIRDVTDTARDAEVDRMARKSEEHGVEMIRVRSTVEAAGHLAERGLVEEGMVEAVAEEREEERARAADGDG